MMARRRNGKGRGPGDGPKIKKAQQPLKGKIILGR